MILSESLKVDLLKVFETQDYLLAEKKAQSLVKKGFSQRRKTIKNALKGLIGENILIKHEIDPSQRPEEISILKWSQLSNVVTKNEK